MTPRASAPSYPLPSDRSMLPTELAFVVRFGGDDRDSGRVEHVVSGRGARFRNREELLAFINDTLARVDAERGCAPNGEPARPRK